MARGCAFVAFSAETVSTSLLFFPKLNAFCLLVISFKYCRNRGEVPLNNYKAKTERDVSGALSYLLQAQDDRLWLWTSIMDSFAADFGSNVGPSLLTTNVRRATKILRDEEYINALTDAASAACLSKVNMSSNFLSQN